MRYMGDKKLKIFTTVLDMQNEIKKLKKYGKSIGFVPTMGYLHDGHIALIKKARKENDLVVTSVFVNPLQFGPTEDFSTYPRNFDRDRDIAKIEKVDYLFYPTMEEMIPSTTPSVRVEVTGRTNVMCGRSRPGHFNGVATILTKFFHIIMPNHVYFGLKDAQQLAIVDGLIKDFHFPIKLVPVETVREEDGLAKSSRNVRLTTQEREQAVHLYQSLLHAKQKVLNGERNRDKIKQAVINYLTEHTNGKIDYVEIYSYPSLEEREELAGKIIIALAVDYSRTRLIDNIIFTV